MDFKGVLRDIQSTSLFSIYIVEFGALAVHFNLWIKIKLKTNKDSWPGLKTLFVNTNII